MPLLLALCSFLMGFASLMTWFEGRRERMRLLVAGRRGEDRVLNRLLQMGFRDIASGFVVTGRNGKRAEIDLVVLHGEAAVVVETKNWSGVVHGSASDNEWHVVKADGSIVIHGNPIFQVSRQCRMLYEATCQPAVGVVMMAGRGVHVSGTFPDGVVANWDALRDGIFTAVSPRKMEGMPGSWERVVALATAPGAQDEALRYGQFVEALIGRKPWLSWLAIAAVTAAASVFLEGDVGNVLSNLFG